MHLSLSCPISLPAEAADSDPFLPQSHTWVKLRDPLSSYSDDEALLLCEATEGRWVAWVPNFGETILAREQFTA